MKMSQNFRLASQSSFQTEKKMKFTQATHRLYPNSDYQTNEVEHPSNCLSKRQQTNDVATQIVSLHNIDSIAQRNGYFG